MNAATTIQSNLSPIEIAARGQHRLFLWYIIVLVVGGLLTAGLTVLLWRATNRYQDAVKTDALARISTANAAAEEAKRAAAQANAEAAKANQRTAEVSLKVEEESHKRAEAEKKVEALRKKGEPRRLPMDVFVNKLKNKRTGIASIEYIRDDSEGFMFSEQICDALLKSGWKAYFGPIDPTRYPILPGLPPIIAAGGQVSGISIVAKTLDDGSDLVKENIRALPQAFLASGFSVVSGVDEKLPEDFFRIIVGAKDLFFTDPQK